MRVVAGVLVIPLAQVEQAVQVVVGWVVPMMGRQRALLELQSWAVVVVRVVITKLAQQVGAAL